MMVGFPRPGYLRRRRMSARPPRPRRAVVVGSGTAVEVASEMLSRVTICGVELPPLASMKRMPHVLRLLRGPPAGGDTEMLRGYRMPIQQSSGHREASRYHYRGIEPSEISVEPSAGRTLSTSKDRVLRSFEVVEASGCSQSCCQRRRGKVVSRHVSAHCGIAPVVPSR